MIKDIEFILKKLFFKESYLLKKRLIRSINNKYEKELQIINKFSDKTKDAVDIGVYRGVYSFKLAQNFKIVHAFEPNPLLYPYLERNLNKIINNIKLYNLALSDTEGEGELKLPIRSQSIFKDNIEELFKLGAASIHKENHFSNYKSLKIEKRRLDDIKISENIGFIKIDVEGHEKNVINGATATIKKNMPVMLIEIEERHTKKPIIQTINYIKEFGYDAFTLKNNTLINILNNNNYINERNFIFIKKT
tara:strand:- start:4419 stop:5165 length:747 start_codon:yes stop_codon:yes gene_type:complete